MFFLIREFYFPLVLNECFWLMSASPSSRDSETHTPSVLRPSVLAWGFQGYHTHLHTAAKRGRPAWVRDFHGPGMKVTYITLVTRIWPELSGMADAGKWNISHDRYKGECDLAVCPEGRTWLWWVISHTEELEREKRWERLVLNHF